jgi:hypothetical protein
MGRMLMRSKDYVCGKVVASGWNENKFGDLLRNAYFCLKGFNYGTGFNIA